MENKTKIYIGLGVLAVAGLSYYLWKTTTEKKPEEKANAAGRLGRVSPRVSPRVAPINTPVGKVKIGDKWIENNQCCVVDQFGAIVCKNAPCSIATS